MVDSLVYSRCRFEEGNNVPKKELKPAKRNEIHSHPFGSASMSKRVAEVSPDIIHELF